MRLLWYRAVYRSLKAANCDRQSERSCIIGQADQARDLKIVACILVTRELGDSLFPGARRQLRGRHGTASGILLFKPTPDLYGIMNIKILGGHNSSYFKILKLSEWIAVVYFEFQLCVEVATFRLFQISHLQLIYKISWVYRREDRKVRCRAKSRTCHVLVFPAATSRHTAILSALSTSV